MAHSIQTYRGKTEVINDLDLLVIIGFAIDIIQRSQEFLSLRSLAAYWQESLGQYGPGVIDLRLDQFVEEPQKSREFDKLLATILEQTRQFGETISGKVLNEQVSVPGITFKEYKVANVENTVERLRALVIGNHK